jgi:hypothetical protein
VSAAVAVDVAGGPMGGAARFRTELYRYLTRSKRRDVKIIGADRRIDPSWLIRRESVRFQKYRRVALNNVSFVAPGGERWTLLRNVLHFLDHDEAARLDPSVVAANRWKARIVQLTAQRADVLVVPCTAMAERVTRTLPSLASRIVVRPHPVSADLVSNLPRDPAILCPVLFAPYKQMPERIAEFLAAMDDHNDASTRLRVTAERAELPDSLACHPRLELVGRLSHADLLSMWARSCAIYYPTGLESFGYPLAEARVNGQSVIARDTSQNKEIAGPALCGYIPGDTASLRKAIARALSAHVKPDPDTFDPDKYFSWLLACPR